MVIPWNWLKGSLKLNFTTLPGRLLLYFDPDIKVAHFVYMGPLCMAVNV